jgi:hypothetical protein
VVLSKAGDQTPGYPFREVVGNGDKAVPLQMGGTRAKVGIMF